MIADTTGIHAHFRRTGHSAARRTRVVAWDDEEYAMIATASGKLQRAREVEGFTELDIIDDGDEIMQLIPANGERVAYTNPEESDPTSPVVAWGLTRNGDLVPFTAATDGEVELEGRDRTLAMTEDGKHLHRST